jgi:GGDEF domain-containing protein
MEARPPRRRRARPVADAPIDTLLLMTEGLTKGWLLALLEQASLDQAPAILAVDLTRDGPRLCDALVRAISDDTDLRRLEPGGALEPLVAQVGELAGAQTLEAVSRAVDALLAVLWSAFHDELRNPDPDQVSQLAERLALIGELVRGAALRRHGAGDDTQPLATTVSTGPRGVAPLRDEEPSLGPRGVAPLRDEEPPLGPSGVRDEEPPLGPREVAPLRDEEPRPRSPGRPQAVSGPVLGGERPTTPEPAGVSKALWVGALTEEIERSEHSSSPLSLLLAELEDGDRVATVEAPAVAAVTFGHFAQAVRCVVRRQDILVRETETRAWIIARETGRAGAQALGSRIAQAVGEGPPWRGAPMSASVGLAVLGEDGRHARELIEAAEEAQFTAAASGIGLVQPATASPVDPAQDEPPADGPPSAS